MQGSRPDGQLNGVLVGQSERQPILGIKFKSPGIVSSCFSKGKDGNWKLKLVGKPPGRAVTPNGYAAVLKLRRQVFLDSDVAVYLEFSDLDDSDEIDFFHNPGTVHYIVVAYDEPAGPNRLTARELIAYAAWRSIRETFGLRQMSDGGSTAVAAKAPQEFEGYKLAHRKDGIGGKRKASDVGGSHGYNTRGSKARKITCDQHVRNEKRFVGDGRSRFHLSMAATLHLEPISLLAVLSSRKNKKRDSSCYSITSRTDEKLSNDQRPGITTQQEHLHLTFVRAITQTTAVFTVTPATSSTTTTAGPPGEEDTAEAKTATVAAAAVTPHTTVLVKYGARGRARDDIAYEFSAYAAARSLQGTVLPQCHGLFSLTPSSSPMANTTDGTEGLFLVEEFLVGYSDVFELCRETPEAFLDAWTEVLAAATTALDMLHDCRIMHGDLRDENLMIQLEAGRPKVKIVDLGGCWISTRPDAQLTNPQRSTEYANLFWMLMGTKDDAERAVHNHQGS
ncbi:MAG: hypothetical protein M1813_009543 [Trichoglossum hirsutum]|nr:MAG: hypothetical protein M1813_009543 [Trichoglossum hirsutum]